MQTCNHVRLQYVSNVADALHSQARIPDLAPRLDANAEEYRADVAFAKGNDSAAASAGLDFPARELLDAINAAVEVRTAAFQKPREVLIHGPIWAPMLDLQQDQLFEVQERYSGLARHEQACRSDRMRFCREGFPASKLLAESRVAVEVTAAASW